MVEMLIPMWPGTRDFSSPAQAALNSGNIFQVQHSLKLSTDFEGSFHFLSLTEKKAAQ